ncbi:MAG: glutamate racemase [Oscillospiraceae bacterium]|nr:glutamate racemase [Oscillospiraceae bacterium]
MDDRPVGIFDSGLGGLTAMRELRRLLPDESVIYFGDTGRMPYGGRPREEIRQMAEQNLDFMEGFDVKAILVACGTISSNAADILESCETKTVGVLLPGVRELCRTGKKRLGVIATATSIKSGAFQREISALAPEAELTAAACPEFVPLIESGHFAADDPLVREAVERSLAPLKQAGVEALLLGCTHFGIIADAIAAYLGGEVILVGAAEAAAQELCAYLRDSDMTNPFGGEEFFFTSGSLDGFEALAPVMLGGFLRGEVSFRDPEPVEVD